MKLTPRLPASFALAGLLLAPSIAQTRTAAGAQEKSANPPVTWSLAVRGDDGKTVVHTSDRPQLPQDRTVTLARELMVGTTLLSPTDDLKRDLDGIARAMKILDERGYEEESARLREILVEVTRRGTIERLEARATQLLEQDVADKAVRVAMLDVVAEGYGLAGWETNEAAMRWFADVGRSQLPGRPPIDRPVPESLRAGSGETMMETLTKIVMKCGPVQRDLGNPNAATVCKRLGMFYRERAAGGTALAQDSPPAPAPRRAFGDEVDPRTADLTYIEGRVPVLRLARNAYGLDGGGLSSEERELGRAWMEWMYAMGRNRVVDDPVDPPPLPGPVSMEGLIETIRRAGDIYDAKGRPREAKRCRALADYYVQRADGDAVDNSSQAARRAPAGEGEPEEPLESPAGTEPSEVEARRQSLQIQIRALEEQIRALQMEIERRRGGGLRR